MDDGNGKGESPRDLTKPRIAPYKNTWKRLQNTVCWVQFEARSRERLAILPNTVTCSRSLQHTTCSLRWVKSHKSNHLEAEGFCWWYQALGERKEKRSGGNGKEGDEKAEELYQKVRLTPRVPRVVLKSNSQHGHQDPQSQDARSSWEPSSDSKSYGETCDSTVDYRISGVPLSAVEQQDTRRENKVKKLIEKFESHKHKESFLQDLSQTQKINKFRKESQDWIADLNNTEIFELCENSSKQQCPDCNAYWEKEIINCSCGRNMKSSQSNRVRAEQPWRHLNPWICD